MVLLPLPFGDVGERDAMADYPPLAGEKGKECCRIMQAAEGTEKPARPFHQSWNKRKSRPEERLKASGDAVENQSLIRII